MENLFINFILRYLTQNNSSSQAKSGANPTAKSNDPAKTNVSSAAANLKNNVDKYIPSLTDQAIANITDTIQTGKEWTTYFRDLTRYTTFENNKALANQSFNDSYFKSLEKTVTS
jgi:hypothetical protein